MFSHDAAHINVVCINGHFFIHKKIYTQIRKILIMNPLQVTDSNLHTFLDGWLDNRVRAIFFTQKEALSARFLAPGYFYRDNVAFGYVNTHDPDARGIISKYNVNKYRETMLMFNEETNSPVATVSVSFIF